MNDFSNITGHWRWIAAANRFLGGVLRTLLYLAVATSGVAVLVGRSQRPAAGRSLSGIASAPIPSNGMRVVVNGSAFEPAGERPRVLDPESGRFLGLDVQDDILLNDASVSSHQDDQGRWQVAGGWRRRSGNRWVAGSLEAGLIRSTFPGGRILDRIVCDPLPVGAPCWYPDRSNRILYPTASGSLYCFQFREGSGGDRDRSPLPTPYPLIWRASATGDRLLVRDPTWPADSRFRNTILVALARVAPETDGVMASLWRIWWLRLNAGGDSIEAAGLLTRPETDADDAPDDERFPSLGGSGGGLVLAYLTSAPDLPGRQLRVAPIDIDPESGIPRTNIAAGRILAAGRMPVRPVFSADGRWVVSARCGDDPAQPADRFFVGDYRERVQETPRSATITERARRPHVSGVKP